MAFEKERTFGVISIENSRVKLYTSRSSYSCINIGKPIKDARWVGCELAVYLIDGKIRLYKTQSTYSTIN